MTDPFSPTAIAQSVHDTLTEALAAIPPGRSGALLLDGTQSGETTTAEALLIQKFGADWVVVGGGTWASDHGIGAKVAIMGSW